MPSFVQALFQRASSGNPLSLTGSKVITLGNTIFVAFGGDPTTVSSVTDNLGNTYTSLGRSGPTSGTLGTCAELFRADITKPGTLTSITINKAESNRNGAIALEFSGVGAVRASGGTYQSLNAAWAYPGPNSSDAADYIANDLWIGAFGQESSNTFTPLTTDPQVAAVEPVAEQISGTGTAGVSVGCLYYISGAGSTGKKLAGQWSGSSFAAGAGAAVQPAVVGVVYNDAPSGSLALSGSSVDSWSKTIINNDAPAGSLALAGTCVDNWGVGTRYTDAPSGALLLAGGVTTSHAVTDAQSGAITLTGSSTDSYQKGGIKYTDAPTGTLSLGGLHVPMTTLIKPLFSGSDSTAGTTLRLSGSADVKAKSTILVALACDPVADLDTNIVVTDNLGNAYSHVVSRVQGSGSSGAAALLFRGDVTQPGTLTYIDITHPSLTARCAIANEFAGIGAVKAVGGRVETSARSLNAFPGGVLTAPAAYSRGNMWVGVFARESSAAAFARGTNPPSVASSEPMPEVQSAADMTVGFLLYKATGFLSNVNLQGTFSPSGPDALAAAAGADFDPIPNLIGHSFSDVVSGGIALSGSCEEFSGLPTVYNDVVSGALAIAGSAVDSWTPPTIYRDAPGGSVALSGSVVESGYVRTVYVDAPAGRMPVTGTVTESRGHSAKVTGKLTLTGSRQESWQHSATRAGALKLAGTATAKQVYSDRVSGSLSVNGTSKDVYKLRFDDSPTGVLRISGTAALATSATDARGGVLLIDGVASDRYISGDRVDYNDRVAGQIVLRGRSLLLREPGFSSVGGHIVLTQTGRAVRRQEGSVLSGTTGRKVKA